MSMTPERIEEIKRDAQYESESIYGNCPATITNIESLELLAALEESQQEAHKQKEEAKRLNEICNQLAGEEMLFQDGKYETEMQRLQSKLEESQQQVKDLKEDKRKIFAVHDEQCARSSEHYNELIFVKGKLVEAQQTIARQQERERSITYEVSEIHKEAAAGNNGSLERADTALNRIMLLSSNLLALGNKEGSDKT